MSTDSDLYLGIYAGYGRSDIDYRAPGADADNQLHLDYEASFGDKYDKSWRLTAGCRHQF
ncbi:MAG: hypothetical protein LBK71_03720 [Verrucomicrobiales bacterium]|nr:hypothetical protein [Verrucomicrobiales bacterium]